MERRITEEQITKGILTWLEKKEWEIICFDFPQSGTGKILHSCFRKGDSKNKDSIIPDIVAIKNETVVFFENKDRFVLSDFEKIKKIKVSNNYSDSISELLIEYDYKFIYYGIGLPDNKATTEKVDKHKGGIDFVVQTNGYDINVLYQAKEIFKNK